MTFTRQPHAPTSYRPYGSRSSLAAPAIHHQLLAGYRVKTAPNGKVALEHARVNRPDLIVLDLMMPVMNGWQFLEAQRQDTGLAAIPVVVTTASLVWHVEGAAVLLGRPFEMDVLLSIAARFCAGGPAHLAHLSA